MSFKSKFLEIILLLFLPRTQLYIRAFNYGGSLDNWWLLFPFNIFPISIIFTILFETLPMKPSKGGNPVDYYLFFPMLTYAFLYFMMDKMEFFDDWSDAKKQVVMFVTLYIISVVVFMVRDYIQCVKNNMNKPESKNPFLTYNFKYAFMDAAIASGTLSAYSLMYTILSYAVEVIPVIGQIIGLIMGLLGEYGTFLFEMVGYFTGYILVNMINFSNDNFCSSSPSNMKKFITVFCCIIIAISLFKKIVLFFV